MSPRSSLKPGGQGGLVNSTVWPCILVVVSLRAILYPPLTKSQLISDGGATANTIVISGHPYRVHEGHAMLKLCYLNRDRKAAVTD